MGKIKILPADKWFSLCVRERTNWTCEYSGTVFDDARLTGKARGLECSHFKGRGNWAVRFEPLNAFAHSTGSHFHLGGNPNEFDAWVRAQLGQENYEVVIELSNDRNRAKEYVKANKTKCGRTTALAAHYKAEYEAMRAKRLDGVLGRIDFKAFI